MSKVDSSEHPLGPLTLDGEKLQHVEDLTRRTYLADSRPWVIGYSGGKDSTALLQLIFYSLSELPSSQLTKPIYVISGDTLVEAPAIVDRIKTTHARIRERAAATGLPFVTEIVRPDLGNTFWVNMIGKGYPAPYQRFRWCTDRMKIQPANLFIKSTVARFGEVVLALGVRRSESATRAQVMSLHKRHGESLSRHSELTGAWVYTPIEDWSTNDVWVYLLSCPSPWGDSNRDLVAMYKNANAGECPLVVDTKTPSCGNSRFGCWVCTVVEHDRSMEAMVDNGEEWMEPMLQFRDFLASTQDPAGKREIRDFRRRDGRVHLWATKEEREEGKDKKRIIWGPYKFEFRKALLKRLLQTQIKVRQQGPEDVGPLITMGELEEIRRLWRLEEGDWEDSVPRIWQDTIGTKYEWLHDDSAVGTVAESSLLTEVASRYDLPTKLLTELIDFERRTTGMHRRSRVNEHIDRILKKDWRSEDEVLRHTLAADEDSDVGASVNVEDASAH